MTKKNKILLIGGTLLLAAVVLLILFRQKSTSRISVTTTEAVSGTLAREVTATGTLEPINQIEVGTQVSGVIEHIFADFNSVVKKGQVLAVLDKSMLEAQVAETRARLASAENDLELQTNNHSRYKQLHEKKTISDADYENAWHAYAKARASVDQIRAELTRADRNLAYATISSPIDGVVLSRAVEEGQTVAASFNTPTLFTIANDLTRMRVIADIDEADIGQVKEGQGVTFTVDAFPDDLFTGTVTQVRLNPHINANVVTYSVVVEAPNPDLKLMPGLTASITVITEEKKGVVLVPSEALMFKPDSDLLAQHNRMQAENFIQQNQTDVLQADSANENSSGEFSRVYILKDGIILLRPVVAGLDDGVKSEIVSGIQPGETVVTAIYLSGDTDAAESSASASPFLPKPPGSNKQSSKPQTSESK